MFTLRSNIKKSNIKKVWVDLTKFLFNSVTIYYLTNINYLKSSLKIKSYWAISLTKLCFRRQKSRRDVWWFLGEGRAPDRKSGDMACIFGPHHISTLVQTDLSHVLILRSFQKAREVSIACLHVHIFNIKNKFFVDIYILHCNCKC